jgi:hypothetical protein
MWLLIQLTSEATAVVILADPFFFFLAHPTSIKTVRATIFSLVKGQSKC